MQRNIGLDADIVAVKLITKVEMISKGRITCSQFFDVTRLEWQDDGTITVVVEEEQDAS